MEQAMSVFAPKKNQSKLYRARTMMRKDSEWPGVWWVGPWRVLATFLYADRFGWKKTFVPDVQRRKIVNRHGKHMSTMLGISGFGFEITREWKLINISDGKKSHDQPRNPSPLHHPRLSENTR